MTTRCCYISATFLLHSATYPLTTKHSALHDLHHHWKHVHVMFNSLNSHTQIKHYPSSPMHKWPSFACWIWPLHHWWWCCFAWHALPPLCDSMHTQDRVCTGSNEGNARNCMHTNHTGICAGNQQAGSRCKRTRPAQACPWFSWIRVYEWTAWTLETGHAAFAFFPYHCPATLPPIWMTEQPPYQRTSFSPTCVAQ